MRRFQAIQKAVKQTKVNFTLHETKIMAININVLPKFLLENGYLNFLEVL